MFVFFINKNILKLNINIKNGFPIKFYIDIGVTGPLRREIHPKTRNFINLSKLTLLKGSLKNALLCKLNHTTPDFVWSQFELVPPPEATLRAFLTHMSEIKISNFGHLEFFYVSDFLNIFSYRADTSIPTTFVVICVIDSKAGAYLLGKESLLKFRDPNRLTISYKMLLLRWSLCLSFDF